MTPERTSDKLLCILLLFFLVLQVPALALGQADSTKAERFILPLVYYTPETSWSFGAAAVMTYPIDSLSPRSQIQLGLAYTLRKQVLVYLPFQLYLKGDQLRFTGELGYYRYNYFFYGIGNDFTAYEGETYGVNFPRLRLNALRRIGKNQFIGFRYAWDNWEVYDQKTGGLLEQQAVVGNEKSTYSALGPLWQWDSRDHIFFPTKGWWAEAALLLNNQTLGATQDFVKWSLDIRKYHSLKSNQVLAGQLYLEGNSGAPSFNQLALLGGTRLLRGYYEGRFRDRQLAATQLEYRFPIKGRFAGVAFGGLGTVVDKWVNWQGSFLRYAVGAGLRFTLLPKDKIRLRFDYGIGPNTSAFYLTVGEAF